MNSTATKLLLVKRDKEKLSWWFYFRKKRKFQIKRSSVTMTVMAFTLSRKQKKIGL